VNDVVPGLVPFRRGRAVRLDNDGGDSAGVEFGHQRLHARRVGATDDDVVRPVRPNVSTATGTVADSAASSAGNSGTGSARKMATTPVTFITLTQTFITGLRHGTSDPKPVVVTDSTTA
jgi:hypothetical protein